MCPAATKKFEVSVESDQHPGPAVLVSGRLAKLTVVVTRISGQLHTAQFRYGAAKIFSRATSVQQ